MISLNEVNLTLNGHPILHNIDLKVSAGSLVVLIGPNGSGKSSLLRCVSGWYTPSVGSVTLNGRDLTTTPAAERAAHLAWLPQRPMLSEPIPVVEWVASARYRFSERTSLQLQKSRLILEELGLAPLADRNWNDLSGGEAQRVALASMVAQESSLWLMDEPANHLDPAVQKSIYRFLISEWIQGVGMLLITHNLNLLFSILTPEQQQQVQIFGLKEGRIVCSHLLHEEELLSSLEMLYGLSVQKITVFDHPHLVFGDPR
jgi:iron complex transport system ATP-binding protein